MQIFFFCPFGLSPFQNFSLLFSPVTNMEPKPVKLSGTDLCRMTGDMVQRQPDTFPPPSVLVPG
jgi:hypothetical protein